MNASFVNVNSDSVCPQRESRLGGVMGPGQQVNPLSEDCLMLNVFTPSIEGKRPVMVWICGGAFVTGSAAFARYDASRLSEEGDIVVVAVSYRVGVLGFLYQPDCEAVNLGLEDQICALEWVRKYIYRFGGNSEHITVCGQSAGAYSIACMMGRGGNMPFKGAILFSPPLSLSVRAAEGQRVRRLFERELGRCTGVDAAEAGIADILEAQAKMLEALHLPMALCPVGERVYPCKVLTGLERVALYCQKDDAQPFVPFPWLTGIATEMVFHRPMLKLARKLRASGIEAECHQLCWHPDNCGIGACHTLEIPFLFGSWEHWSLAPMLSGLCREEYERRGLEFRKAIAYFVKR